MSALDKVRMEIPDGSGDVFVGEGNLQVTENQQPFYLIDGFQNIRTLAEQTPFLASDTSQAYVGSGARVRTWQISFESWEGETSSWGSANADDDVLTKLNVLGQTLATAGLSGRKPAILEYGEYSTNGTYSPKEVVPGEISLPAEFGPDGTPSSFRPTLEWRDAADLRKVLHEAP